MDPPGTAPVPPGHFDNLDRVTVRLVSAAAIFQRVGAKPSEEGQPVDDELHETVKL